MLRMVVDRTTTTAFLYEDSGALRIFFYGLLGQVVTQCDRNVERSGSVSGSQRGSGANQYVGLMQCPMCDAYIPTHGISVIPFRSRPRDADTYALTLEEYSPMTPVGERP